MIPTLAKHMAVAIFKKLDGSVKERAQGAWDITLASMEKNGLGKPDGKGTVKLTPTGQKRSSQHAQESNSFVKVAYFDKYIRPHLKIGDQESTQND